MSDITPSRMVARRISEIRRERGLSAQQLADRCTKAGRPVSRGSLANIESGQQHTISIDLVLTLAYALEVPPVMLMVPGEGTGQLQITDSVTMPMGQALTWITGDLPLADTEEGQRAAAQVQAIRDYLKAARTGADSTLLLGLVKHLVRVGAPLPDWDDTREGNTHGRE